jgi:hypothetical protein
MDEGRKGGGDPGDDPRNTPFLAILLYVLGFMAGLALLAWALARLLRPG